MRSKTLRLVLFGLGFCALAVAVVVAARFAESPRRATGPNALWRIVHRLCVPDMKVTGVPAPCTAVDLAQGYAILKDIKAPTELLLIPTVRVTGIEDPKVLDPAAPNYWALAWAARPLFEKRVGHAVPREDVGLAVNSIYGRSQDQLHVHIDCVRPNVRQALKAEEGQIGYRWSTMKAKLVWRHYRVMRIDGADLGRRNPFRLLADMDARARAEMGDETLVLIGATFRDGRPGFFLLSDHADLAVLDTAHGEDLLDHRCRVLGSAG